MGENVGNFSFNKGQKINLAKFDGVSKQELSGRKGITDGQKNLLMSIFSKYDNGDGVLSADEFKNLQADLIKLAGDNNLGKRELKNFNKNVLGVDKKAYSMEDLQAVIGMMTDGSDSITNVAKDGEYVKITYKPQEGVRTKTSTFATDDKHNLSILADDVVNDGVSTHIEYLDGDTTKRTKMTETKGDSVTTTLYENDGTSIKSKTRMTGAVTEELDFENGDRVKTKKVDKGGGNEERTEYQYLGDGYVGEATYNTANGEKPVCIIVRKSDGSIDSQQNFIYEEGKTTKTYTVGSGDDAVRTRTVTDNGKLESYVDVDANGNVLDSIHTVAPGDTWYGIVQAKYGVTDHKTTMEIVHKLKDSAKIPYLAKTMPGSITLPARITLADNKVVDLKNKDALVNMTHGVKSAPSITPLTRLSQTEIPEAIEPLPKNKQTITIPVLDVKIDCADQTVKQNDGRYFEYNADGRVKHIYADEEAKDTGNNAVLIVYDDSGNVFKYCLNTYNAAGYWTGGVAYDGSGNFSKCWVNDQFDDNGNYGRQTCYNVDGNVYQILDNYKYDEQGRVLSYDNFYPDGSWCSSRKLDYGNDGTCQTRYYGAKDKGRLTEVESFE